MGGRTHALGLSGMLGGNDLPAYPVPIWSDMGRPGLGQKGCEAYPHAPDATCSTLSWPESDQGQSEPRDN